MSDAKLNELTPMGTSSWKRFLASISKTQIICIVDKDKCHYTFSYKDSSPKSAKKHLSEFHKIDYEKINYQTLEKYHKEPKFNEIKTMESSVAKLICVDNISYNKVANSQTFQDLLQSKYKSEPPTTIYSVQKHVNSFYDMAKKIIQQQIEKLLKNGHKPNIMIDE